MTGEDGSEILFAEVPLDNGRRKVAADADSGEEHRCCGNHPPLYCVVLEEEIIKNEEESEVEEHSYNYSADCTLNTLFRADIRSELMLAKLSADKIRKCVIEPRGQKRHEDNEEYVRLLEQIGAAQAEISEQGYGRHNIRHDNAAEHRHNDIFKLCFLIAAEHDEHHSYDIDYCKDICRKRQL